MGLSFSVGGSGLLGAYPPLGNYPKATLWLLLGGRAIRNPSLSFVLGWAGLCTELLVLPLSRARQSLVVRCLGGTFPANPPLSFL